MQALKPMVGQNPQGVAADAGSFSSDLAHFGSGGGTPHSVFHARARLCIPPARALGPDTCQLLVIRDIHNFELLRVKRGIGAER
jgi:hypothetical protein